MPKKDPKTTKTTTNVNKTLTSVNAPKNDTLQQHDERPRRLAILRDKGIVTALSIGLVATLSSQVGLLHHVDFAHSQATPPLLAASALLVGSLLYVMVLLPLQLGRRPRLQDWQTDFPLAVRAGTIGATTSVMSGVVLLWPVYGLGSVFIVLVFCTALATTVDFACAITAP